MLRTTILLAALLAAAPAAAQNETAPADAAADAADANAAAAPATDNAALAANDVAMAPEPMAATEPVEAAPAAEPGEDRGGGSIPWGLVGLVGLVGLLGRRRGGD